MAGYSETLMTIYQTTCITSQLTVILILTCFQQIWWKTHIAMARSFEVNVLTF
jgi:hypothetical protein